MLDRAYRPLGWTYVVVCSLLVLGALLEDRGGVGALPAPAPAPQPPPAVPQEEPDAAQWFRRVKPYCNSVEVATIERRDPPMAGVDGVGYHASCLALAGRIDDARRAIDRLEVNERAHAASIVFDVGHPVADAGDDRSAGPMMEVVVDYIPDHYMALYHAAMAEYMLGQRDLARKNLQRFLKLYSAEDGWRRNALDVLGRLDAGSAEDADRRRPREPGR